MEGSGITLEIEIADADRFAAECEVAQTLIRGIGVRACGSGILGSGRKRGKK